MKRPETVQTEKHEKPKIKKNGGAVAPFARYLMRYKY